MSQIEIDIDDPEKLALWEAVGELALIKARSLMVHDDPDTQREDLLRLLALIDDPRETAAELLKTERNWLRNAEQRLNLAGSSRLDADTTRRADLAYRLLVRNS